MGKNKLENIVKSILIHLAFATSIGFEVSSRECLNYFLRDVLNNNYLSESESFIYSVCFKHTYGC